MGPLTLADFVGLDTLGSICDVLFDEFRERRFARPPTLRKDALRGMVRAQVGMGFYDYSATSRPRTRPCSHRCDGVGGSRGRGALSDLGEARKRALAGGPGAAMPRRAREQASFPCRCAWALLDEGSFRGGRLLSRTGGGRPRADGS